MSLDIFFFLSFPSFCFNLLICLLGEKEERAIYNTHRSILPISFSPPPLIVFLALNSSFHLNRFNLVRLGYNTLIYLNMFSLLNSILSYFIV